MLPARKKLSLMQVMVYQALKRQCHNRVVTPRNVSPTLFVPEHIEKPAYRKKKWHFLPQSEVVPRSPEVKNAEQIKGMRDTCKLAAEILHFAGEMVKPGVTTDEIDKKVHQKIVSNNAYPSPLLYKG